MVTMRNFYTAPFKWQSNGTSPWLQPRSLGDVLGNPTYDNLGDAAGAESCYAKSLEILARAESPGGGDELAATLTRVRLAQLLLFAGRPDDALPYFEQFVALAADRDARGRAPTELRADLAGVFVAMGSAHGVRRELDRALELFEMALALRCELLAEQPDDPDRQLQVAVARSKVATARWTRKDPGALDDLRQALSEAVAVAERVPDVPRFRRTVVETATLFADVLLREGDLDAAQRALDDGLRHNDALCTADPDNAFYRRQRGLLTYNQAWLLRDRGRRERTDGVDAWRSTIGAGIDWLGRSKQVWQDMQGRSELQPRERGHIDRLDREIAELERELAGG
jgi:hypothetical protein